MNEDKKFSLKIKNFEGPFDLLLDLIQKKKLSINDISLSEITDNYLSFLKENEMKLKDKSYFIWTASTLMLIKSKTLLPKLELEEEEEGDIDELKKRLKILKEIKNKTYILKDNFLKNILYKKKNKKRIEVVFSPNDNINFDNLILSLDRIFKEEKTEQKLSVRQIKKVKSLKEVMIEIHQKIEKFLKMNFSEIISGQEKKEKAVSFLAILELFKNNEIDLEQESNFSEILLKKK